MPTRNSNFIKFIEYPLLEHCNLDCAMCCRFSPVAEPSIVSLEQFTDDMRELRRITKQKVVQLRILGGEPLMVPNLTKYLKVARENFPLTWIVISTNGILLDKMPKEFYSYIIEEDIRIKVSNYVGDRTRYIRIAERRGIKQLSFVDKPYFKKLNIMMERTLDGNDTYNKCFLGGNCLTIYKGYIYICPIVSDLHILNKKFNTNFKTTEHDKIRLEQLEDVEQLVYFIDGDKSDSFCTQCGRVSDEIQEWYHSNKTIDEWVIQKQNIKRGN